MLLQIQSVLFKTEKQGVITACEALDNAWAHYQQGATEPVLVVYGDASPEPLFSPDEIEHFNEVFKSLNIQYVFFGENTGTAKGHNRLAAFSSSQYIMVTNPDIVVSPDYFNVMMRALEENEDIGLVEARQTPLEQPKEYDVATGETSWASTAAVIFPRAVYDGIGGFDSQTFFLYCDDVDFSWRIRLFGKRVVYLPTAVVFHAKSLSLDARWVPTAAEKYYSIEAALLLAHKWSRNDIVEKLLRRFQASKDDRQIKAASEFIRKRDAGLLVKQIDKEHAVGDFNNGLYGKFRFIF